ncbi:MAG: putative addiction module antidote protein [Chlamydiales bacterium]|jgi:probable addiction module antidote protein
MGKTIKYRDHLSDSLGDPEEASAYLNACLEDEDVRVFLLALKDVADANGGMSKLAEESTLNRQSLYRALSKSGNPKLVSILSILSAFGLKICIRPSHKQDELLSSDA